jgi:hypothetical protein
VLRAFRDLVAALVVILGLTFLAAFLYQRAGGVDAHRAYSVVFYVGGGVLLLFALLTRGAEGRVAFLGGVGLERVGRVREQERTLNPTGVLVLAAILLLVLGGVFDTILSSS